MNSDFIHHIVSQPYVSVRTAAPSVQAAGQTDSFADVLRKVEREPNALKVSAHASQRLEQRGLHLTGADWSRLGQAVDKAQTKGAKEAFLMYGDTGLVVNVPNRTVITAMVNQADTVVTNIDSVVIVPRLDR